MRKIQRHLLAIGIVLIALSVCLFCIIGYNNYAPTISVSAEGVIISLSSTRIGVLAFLAVILGACGIGIGGYSIIRRKADRRELDEALGINKLRKK